MKSKILFGTFALAAVLFSTGCSEDEDYTIQSNPLLTENSVKTGSADVTPVSATLYGNVQGLESLNTGSYTVGFFYGNQEDQLSEKVMGTSGSSFSCTISGTHGQTIYYQAFVTLQGKVTYKGQIEHLLLTDVTAIALDASAITCNTATVAGQTTNLPSGAIVGATLSLNNEQEAVRGGLQVEGVAGAEFSIELKGLLPSTTYYYTVYADLGNGKVYGEIKDFTTSALEVDVNEDFVDLGLSTKWAKVNLGASSEAEFGGLFGFGDLSGVSTSIDPAEYAQGNIYKTAQDIANRSYGGKATLPTIEEFEELFTCCKVEWIEDAEKVGYKFTGTNGNSIFMPAAGSRTRSTIEGQGSIGRYLSGSINPTDNTYAMSFLFNSSSNARTTTPVYQALSVRPVTVAKNVKFDKSLLYKTWEIDIDTAGTYKTFPGPSYFYGTDDSWRTITNNEPMLGDSWCWDPDYAGNAWVVGSAKNCQGSIQFTADSVFVTHINAEGTQSVERGTYTLNEETKSITLKGATVLAPGNYDSDYVVSLTDDIKILSLTDASLQLMLIRKNDPCGLSINMIPQLEKYGYTAKLTCYGAGVNGDLSDGWNSAATTVAGGKTGSYSITFKTTEPRANGQVYVLDIEGFAEAYPNAFVRIDAIKADDKEVKFDANKFFYGNIENNGKFRVEMANIWGVGHNDGWNGLKDTPFSQAGGETTNETALAFNSTFQVDFTVVSLDANLSFTAKQTAVGLNADWVMPGNWGIENKNAIKVTFENNQYKLATTDPVALTINAADCENGTPANGAVNLVDITEIRSYFPGFSAELLSVVNDGTNVPFDATKLKVGDIEGNGNFRIELHNIWGSGTAADPAFGGAVEVAGNNCVTSLGFTTSSVYTIGNYSANLFPLPW